MFNTFDVRQKSAGKKNFVRKPDLANKENIDIGEQTQKFTSHLHRYSELAYPDNHNNFIECKYKINFINFIREQ